ncbi:cation efflux protein [Aulographum hederae CBS 113979]|uniref:Cation efflux protein n=1 Tax=Aulographum hederae CBS 113979 TaxID=1176131 RepID=A0A6G1GWV1_9PEZI|nr:cation efflux protein [Aulographum hederae CBS 113979]
MGLFSHITPSQRLSTVIGISFCFFVAEITVGFYTHSLALIADAFHYLNDLVGFVVALIAIQISQRGKSPKEFSFGWQRAQLLGAFFNGVFLAALGLSIFLQALERFVNITRVEDPKLVLIIGGVGLGLNIISAVFLATSIHSHDHAHDHSDDHDHDHDHGQKGEHKGLDLNMLGALIHVIGDALNNIGVMASALAIWFGKSDARFYADPAISMAIAFMIFASSVPLVRRSGAILLQSAGDGVDVEEVRRDLETLPGISGVHDLHIWRLDQRIQLASAHLLTADDSLANFMVQAKAIGERLHQCGVHSYTLQPELIAPPTRASLAGSESEIGLVSDAGEMGVGGVAEEAEGDRGSDLDLGCRIKCGGGDCGGSFCCEEKKS